MAKILYGVAGEGSGHSSRAKEIINYLEGKGHLVKVLSHDRGFKNLNPYFDVEEIFGLRFDYKNNQIRPLPTIYRNFAHMPQAMKSIKKVTRIIDEFRPDIVFSDFEPISCLMANMKKIPLISIDNQHRLNNTQIRYPKKYQANAAAAIAVINLMIFGTKACLVTTFSQSKIKNGKTFLFPPILRQEVLNIKPSIKDYILVYLTSEYSYLPDLLQLIQKKFIIYGFDKNEHSGNIRFKKASQKEFLDDLVDCQGVIANAGFTLISEALHLGKPYLAIPLKRQFEQIYNAVEIEQLGYGKHWDEIDREKIEAFLFNIDIYAKNLKKYKKEDNGKIFKKIDELIKKYTQ